MEWHEEAVMVDGVRLTYLRSKGSGPLILCAHGLTDNAHCWDRLAAALASNGYQVVAYDARGHGHSDAPATGFTAEGLAADLAGLVGALQLAQPILLGHSLGAHTCALAAAGFPNLARAVILEDPPWRETPRQVSSAERELQTREIETNRRRNVAEIIAAYAKEVAGWHSADIEPWAVAKRQVNPLVFGWFDRPPDWRSLLPRLTCPTLLLTGDPARGAIVTGEIAAEARTLCPQLQHVTIAGAGHSIRRDRFNETLAAMRDFLEQVSR